MTVFPVPFSTREQDGWIKSGDLNVKISVTLSSVIKDSEDCHLSAKETGTQVV